MEPISEEQRGAIAAAGWTVEEVDAFLADLNDFRSGLGDKQRDTFDRVLSLAGATANGDDVSGFLVVPAIIGVLIPMMLPSVQKPPRPTPPPPPRPR